MRTRGAEQLRSWDEYFYRGSGGYLAVRKRLVIAAAILIAGRSVQTYAAQIGTMKR
ncbi:MAG: hypothetical protein IPM88_20885 [Nitrospira sp.]|nr:hypothetical protein [Nitrospira sp.]